MGKLRIDDQRTEMLSDSRGDVEREIGDDFMAAYAVEKERWSSLIDRLK